MTQALCRCAPDGVGELELSIDDRGVGRPVLLLHGGAGPQSMGSFAALLAGTCHVRVITPVHPGFAATTRPASLDSVVGLAAAYSSLLDALDLTDVTVIGNSFGGSVAAELALLGSARVARLVLLDATGIEVPGHPVADVTGLAPAEIAALAFYDAAPFVVDPSTLPMATRSAAASDSEALATYTGATQSGEKLATRLPHMALATLVAWGEGDRIVDLSYGRAFADAIPGAGFVVLPHAGHMPQVETPEQVVTAVSGFLTSTAAWEHDYTANTTLGPEAVWRALSTIYTGATLNDDGDRFDIDGPFAVGTTLSATPRGADFVVHCVITELEVNETFAYRSNFNGLYLTSRHVLTRLPSGGTRVNHHSIISGPGAEAAGPALGARITSDRQEGMEHLFSTAEALMA